MAEVTAEELSKVVLLDVRTPEEFSEGHIPNALNINWFDEDFLDQADKALPKDQTIYLYCRSGRRSGLAAEKLIALGYTILDLEGGYQAYQKTEHYLKKIESKGNN
ncbi:rhodanese-like domain-containing protein [Cellulophaga sp. Hel_I_12]|uniref:rhodanese-like domain-containing protein n=1 Tax=Cellulophaga sp. Hel_I_12 TaxID=1249972 RepID=UPI000A5CBE51|nr:rhodanese-like domain-containing protein [Cellulophaga sp. Hel_I_12]